MNDLQFHKIDWWQEIEDEDKWPSLDSIDWWYIVDTEGEAKEGVCIVGNEGRYTYEVTISAELLINMVRTVVGEATGSRVKIHWQD